MDGAQYDSPTLFSSHGTEVSGVGCAEYNNGIGTAGLLGSCEDQSWRFRFAKIFGDGATAETTNEKVIQCINWAILHEADIINLSLGSPDYNTQMQQIISDNAQERLFVAAVGNSGPGSSAMYPAAYENVIAVGAVDQALKPASFSSDNPDVVGPGAGVITLSLSAGLSIGPTHEELRGDVLFLSSVPTAAVTAKVCRANDGCGFTIGVDCANPEFQQSQSEFFMFFNRCPNNDEGGLTAAFQECQDFTNCVGVVVVAEDPLSIWVGSDPTFQNTREQPYLQINFEDSAIIEQALENGDEVVMNFAMSAYTVAQGSSIAAFHVSSFAAWLMSLYPGCKSEVGQAIIDSATATAEQHRVGAGIPNFDTAAGILNAMPCAPGSTPVSENNPGSTTGNENNPVQAQIQQALEMASQVRQRDPDPKDIGSVLGCRRYPNCDRQLRGVRKVD